MRGTSLSLIAIMLLFIGCVEPSPTALTRGQRRLLDSLTREEHKVIKKQMDSLCVAEFDVMVDHLTDSLLEAELNAIKRISQ